MAKKQLIKPTEARILAVLYHTPIEKHYAPWIAQRLDVDKGYVYQLLKSMEHRYWLDSVVRSFKRYYGINEGKAPPVDIIDKMIAAQRYQKNKHKQLMLTT